MAAPEQAPSSESDLWGLGALANPVGDPLENRIQDRAEQHELLDSSAQASIPRVPLFCGSEQPLTDAYFYEHPPAFAAFLGIDEPARLPRPQKKPRSNGCGGQIHASALPVPHSGVWAGDLKGVSTNVIPLEDKYVPPETGAMMMAVPGRVVCGCAFGFVGCAVCGNPLGMLFEPCNTHITDVSSHIYSFLPTTVSPPLPYPSRNSTPPRPPPPPWTLGPPAQHTTRVTPQQTPRAGAAPPFPPSSLPHPQQRFTRPRTHRLPPAPAPAPTPGAENSIQPMLVPLRLLTITAAPAHPHPQFASSHEQASPVVTMRLLAARTAAITRELAAFNQTIGDVDARVRAYTDGLAVAGHAAGGVLPWGAGDAIVDALPAGATTRVLRVGRRRRAETDADADAEAEAAADVATNAAWGMFPAL
ncbi:hypothetical protein C8R44DRAFT_989086 [Mycena epipterygia]|nr:hypothetical protein C8R44DRAFT_989086 [Mycena epipterygia]